MLEIVDKFNLEGSPLIVKNYANGLVNKTYLVETTKHKYILQRINNYVFKNPLKVMNNIELITRQLKEKNIPTLSIVYTKDSKNIYYDKSDNSYYRMYKFLTTMENVVDKTSHVNLEVGKAIGEFQSILATCDTTNLDETIINFHNTPLRLRRLKEVYTRLDSSNSRKQKSASIYHFLISQVDIINVIQQKIDKELIPIRIAHNDTKLSNIMFDKNTKKALALVDLDTVMPGTALFDYADAVRTTASTACEAEKELSKVDIDDAKFVALTIGYLSKMHNVLNHEELDCLFVSVETIIMECCIRFLTDYLENDTYFKIDYDEQNYDRAINQLTLYTRCLNKKEKYEKLIKLIIKRLYQ